MGKQRTFASMAWQAKGKVTRRTRGGLGAVAAESLAVKHQLLIMKRAQRRAPNLTSWDRLVLGACALLVSPKRLSKMAVILKPSTPSVLSPRLGEAQVSPAL